MAEMAKNLLSKKMAVACLAMYALNELGKQPREQTLHIVCGIVIITVTHIIVQGWNDRGCKPNI